jgi:2,5-furandicarboxylate decarboxylase 1
VRRFSAPDPDLTPSLPQEQRHDRNLPAPTSTDMRSGIAELQAAGELIRVDKPVDPLTQMALCTSAAKAVLFEKLPHGWRSLGQAPANVRHAAVAFGVSEEELIPHVAAKLGARIAPVTVKDGPVKEVKLKRGEFDLTQLPVHIAGQRDGGPVIGSGLVVSKDPDTGKRNLSFHRLQIKGPDKSGILLYPRHTGLLKYQEAPADAGGDLHRHHPLTTWPRDDRGLCDDEFEIAAFLGSRALVKCGRPGGPANAEIVLEGHIPPHVRGTRGRSPSSRITTSPVPARIPSSSTGT